MNCSNCNNLGSLRNQLILCDFCYKINPFVLISIEDAKNRYTLSKKDLNNINYTYKKDFLNKNSMHFLLSDVENIALNKFGGRVNAIKTIKYIQDRKKELQHRKFLVKKCRKENILEIIKNSSMDPNYINSKLCIEYINKGEKSGLNLNDLSSYLEEMHFYEKFTEYNKFFIEYKKKGEYSNLDELVDDVKKISLEKFAKDNLSNFKDIYQIVPDCLKYKILDYIEIKIHEF